MRDTGIGIDNEKLDVIFESFRQLDRGLSRSYSGLGLGLAIAQKIATLFGGGITVQSTPGLGSEFTVRFPLRTAVEVESKSPADVGVNPASRPAILLVEDNAVSQMVITRLLARHGFHVHCAGSGAKAIEAARSASYDLVLMDLQMPEMDGLEATNRLRGIAAYEDTPIIALTANASDEVRELCKAEGMQGFIAKPVHGPELIAHIERYLEMRVGVRSPA